MKNIPSKIFSLAAGALLIVAGILCLTKPDTALLTVAAFIGIFMLISGIAELAVFFDKSSRVLGAGWVLLDGIITVILGLILTFNQTLTLASLPFLFAVWLIFSGASRFVGSLDLKILGISGWMFTMALGILMMLGGVFSMFNPLSGLLAMSLVLGATLILEGVDTIVAGFVTAKPRDAVTTFAKQAHRL